ncbi:RimK family alpha-L-glutamate ligase [Rhodoligotrophos appendicifer]|uniref:ATP-grasp domain-containing protein n=1 Tax=Rhodoligotrophos appendicifer TaxID=987056 RepID=UPI001FEB5C57|nr:RimK family alpha-L-glutamate ligase [Rhodoligotrophos appendicifer]
MNPFAPRIALFAETRDSHARALSRRLEAGGAEVRRISLAQCSFDTTRRIGIVLPGYGRALPDAAIVRSIPSGSFEAVTRRLGILHGLREQGVLVWNDARAIERCVDKSTTSFLLARAGIGTPATWTVESKAEAERLVRREMMSGPLVLKPLFGAQGRGIRLIQSPADLPEAGDVAGVYYLQRFIGLEQQGFRDYRVFVVAGRAIAAMVRHSTHWVTNVKQGGQPLPLDPDPELDSVAVRAAAAVGADFCGVDIIRNRAGEAAVLEVNSMPAWSGLQKVTEADIPGEIAAALLLALDSVLMRRDVG